MPETQKTAGSSAVVEQAAESSLLDQIVEQGRFGDPTAREARQRSDQGIRRPGAGRFDGSAPRCRSDDLCSRSGIHHEKSHPIERSLHNPQFQKLESTWRGLKYLLDQV